MLKYIDAHCHILTEDQIKNAHACGVDRFIVNATRPAEWDTIVEMARRDDILGAIGVHPWNISGLRDNWDDELVKLLAENHNVMVGEIGLDKNHPNPECQESVFRRQLQIAYDFGRVVHIHCVGTWGNMMDILRSVTLPPVMIFHGFSGSVELMKELSKLNAYFSFGSMVNDNEHTRLRLCVAAVPATRILIESDAPDGVMPDKIPEISAEIARIRGVSVDEMSKIIYNNTMGLLNDKSV